MNRTVLLFAFVAVSTLTGHAQTTNNPPGVDPFVLNGLSFSGDTAEVAATISGIDSFESANSSFQGGQGDVLSGDASQDASGASGIRIDDVNSSVLDSTTVVGGVGGKATVTTGSAQRQGKAKGGAAISFNALSGTQKLEISGGDVAGGNGGIVSGLPAVKLFSDGGSGVHMSSGGILDISSFSLKGGDGGDSTTSAGIISSRGGSGVLLLGDGEVRLGADVSAAGGNGGRIGNTSDNSPVQAFGGDAVRINSAFTRTHTLIGGDYNGGHGGEASFSTDIISDLFLPENYFDADTGSLPTLSGARGGHGLRMFNIDYALAGSVVNIDGGTFRGGDGGISSNSGVGDSFSEGGHGIFTDFVDMNISGGTFTGGAAGQSNGQASEEGYGVYIRDGNLLVTDGVFEGKGLVFESHNYDSSATIQGGMYDEATFFARYDEFFVEKRINSVEISGGVFKEAVFTGDSGGLDFSENNVNVTGGSFDKIILAGDVKNELSVSGAVVDYIDIFGMGENTATLTGANVERINFSSTGTNLLNVIDNGRSIDLVDLYGGANTLNFNGNQEIGDIYISNGTLNVTGSDLSLAVSNSHTLIAETAQLIVERDMIVSGSLDVGAGSLTVGSRLTVEAGSTLKTAIAADGAGVKGGTMLANSATFGEDVKWTMVNDGSITSSDSFNDGVLLASASVNDGITHSFDENGLDFSLIGNPSVLLGINGVTNYFNASSSRQELYATYGQLSLEKVFEHYPEMGPAMADLEMVLDTDPDLAAYISSEWSDFDTLSSDFSQSFIRTPEMGTVLMGLQGVFADQIKDRTRSNLRYKKFGSKTSYTPAGARGPADWYGSSSAPSGARGPDWYDNSVQWTEDHLPTWDARGASRKIADDAPLADTDVVKKSMNAITPKPSSKGIEVPETYQVWGRAYGSRLDQDSTTTGHMGYDATIVGGVIGVDKRFENMLIGLGGGYAHTDLNGNGGNDGDADTAYAMGYFSHSSDSLYVDATLNYAFNDVETEGPGSVGYEGEYDASTVGFGIGTGYGMSFYKDKLLFTPEASYLGTYYTRGSYTEKSNLATPFPDKEYESYDQWSHLTSIGATLSTIGVLDYFNAELEYQPELRAHWLHEFNAEMDDDAYVMVGGSGDPLAVALQAREEDLIRLGAGIRFSKWQSDTTEFGFDIDGAFGSDYQNFIVSGKIMHRF